MQNHLIKTEDCINSFFPPNYSYQNPLNPRTVFIGKVFNKDWDVPVFAVSGVPSLLKLWGL